ncbi:hypothetical protein S2091_4418 [Solimicrobium silvestre]|uniref:Uncharacterized protein n=1 Tax=Solimicrobium silvestre TaxID=2099400 RepID=A0A2S9GSZ5_9BURK|nr:hypothetical protein S2091_4418 [Solimicrobium silvestre]
MSNLLEISQPTSSEASLTPAQQSQILADDNAAVEQPA